MRCNDPSIKSFAKEIQLYTNSHYTSFNNEGILYFLFDNKELGHYYVDSTTKASKACGKATLKHSPDTVKFN